MLLFCASDIFIHLLCVMFIYICAYIDIHTHVEMKYLGKHMRMIKHYIAVFHVSLGCVSNSAFPL